MNLEARRMVPLAHAKAAPPSGWLPRWSAKKERQLARRNARFEEEREHERAQREQKLREREPPAQAVVLPRPFWRRVADRVRRFLRRTK